MDDFWWQLPGPQHFVRGIGEDLRAGKSVCMALPTTLSALDLKRAVAFYVHEYCDTTLEEYSLYDLELATLPVSQALVQAFDLATDDFSEIHSVQFLVNAPRFAGRIIWVKDLEAVSPAVRQQWWQFLQEFAHVSRMCSPSYRTVFCVVASGSLGLETSASDVLLSKHWWWNTVARLDMALYVRNRMLHSGVSGTLAEPIIAELSGFDADLAAVLAAEQASTCEDWSNHLATYGRMRQWEAFVGGASNLATLVSQLSSPLDLPPELRECWARGMLNWISGEGLHVHSAVVAFNGAAREVCRRIWRAQVRLILPYVDEQRIAVCAYLLRRYGLAQLGLVVSSKDEAYGQLEIGDLKHLLDTKFRNEHSVVRELVHWLHYIRNQIAHLQILDQFEIERCYQLAAAAEIFLLESL
jgi:hypothetical protein